MGRRETRYLFFGGAECVQAYLGDSAGPISDHCNIGYIAVKPVK